MDTQPMDSARSAAHEVTRVVFASVSRMEGSVMDQLLAIRNDLCSNKRVRVNYAGVYTSGWFVVWLEGSDDDVTKAMRILGDDPRNQHQKLLHRSRGPATLHERVVVASTQTPLRPTEFAKWVMHMRDQGRFMEPQDIWNRLGAPCLADRMGRPCTRPTQQYVLVAAEDHGPVDQLRKIGEQYKSPVIYQRIGLARSHSPDLGMAYVDVPSGEGTGRIRMITRLALAQPAVRRSMPQMEAIVLMVGTRPSSAIELATNVADAVKNLPVKPKIWLAGPEGEPTSACARLLERCGVKAHIAPHNVNGRVSLSSLLPILGDFQSSRPPLEMA